MRHSLAPCGHENPWEHCLASSRLHTRKCPSHVVTCHLFLSDAHTCFKGFSSCPSCLPSLSAGLPCRRRPPQGDRWGPCLVEGCSPLFLATFQQSCNPVAELGLAYLIHGNLEIPAFGFYYLLCAPLILISLVFGSHQCCCRRFLISRIFLFSVANPTQAKPNSSLLLCPRVFHSQVTCCSVLGAVHSTEIPGHHGEIWEQTLTSSPGPLFSSPSFNCLLHLI